MERALGKDSATLMEEGTLERSGEGSGGSAGFCVCCCASVLWMVANLRCRRSTCVTPGTHHGMPGASNDCGSPCVAPAPVRWRAHAHLRLQRCRAPVKHCN